MRTTTRTRSSRGRSTLASPRLNNLYWELRLGISTRGVVPIAQADSCHYATESYALLWRVLDHLALGPSDVFIDIGCGKGRVLCGAARYPVMRVHGLDLSAPLCEAARENARRMRGRRAPIFVETTLADEFDYSMATVLFLYEPFGRATLEPLLEKIDRERRFSVRIAYVNTSLDDVYQRQGWLEQTEHWDADSELEHAVSFYRSRG
jgi:SAM-dependent methyltransferase